MIFLGLGLGLVYISPCVPCGRFATTESNKYLANSDTIIYPSLYNKWT